MKYGHFDAAPHEFANIRPEMSVAWVSPLGCAARLDLASNTAGVGSFSKDARWNCRIDSRGVTKLTVNRKQVEGNMIRAGAGLGKVYAEAVMG